MEPMSEIETTALSGSPRGKPEVLAPAGDMESLIAALRHGADAVYFGLDVGFNARARAANFTIDDLKDTVETIHLCGARAYLTLNTLVFEPELKHVANVLREVARSGVDAIIVQDPAICLLAQAICPALHVHASTQMTISSAHAASFAKELGVVRVVVPRELSVAEIAEYQRGTDLELEVFVHGALCVSWSGQCLTSEAWSGRSANRGQCAQSCRLPYSLEVDGERRDLGDVRYLLSPRDLAGARAVPDLAQIGVKGLKIEGRQKGKVYVATAAHGYRRLVDGLPRAMESAEGRAELERGFRDDLRAMSLAYTRGFSDGFLGGSDHQTLIEGRFPKHRGTYLGRVLRVDLSPTSTRSGPVRGGEVWVSQERAGRRADCSGARGLAGEEGRNASPLGETSSPLEGFRDAATADPRDNGPEASPIELRSGMGVVFDAGDPEAKDEPGGPLFGVDAREGEWLLRFGNPGPDLKRVHVGDRVWVTSDPKQQVAVDGAIRGGPPLERVPLAIRVEGRLGGPLVVDAKVVGCEYACEKIESGSMLEAARGGGLDSALLADKLCALGGTHFRLASLEMGALEGGLHLPVSELKAMRRRLVERLEELVRRGEPREIRGGDAIGIVAQSLRTRVPAGVSPDGGAGEARIVPLCRNDEQLAAVIEARLFEVELDYMELIGLKRAVERARAAGLRVTIATLRIEKPLEERFFDAVAAISPDGLLVRHWSGLVRAASLRDPPRLHGDFSLNVTNSLTALLLLGKGLCSLTPGYDLDAHQLEALLDQVSAAHFTLPLWHRVPAFHTEHCVYSHLLSNGRDHRTCGRPCEEHRITLVNEMSKDSEDAEHPVIVDAGCRNTVFDGMPQSPASLVPELLRRGLERFRVEFLREDRDATARILLAARELLDGGKTPREFLAATGARESVGVGRGRMKSLVDSSL